MKVISIETGNITDEEKEDIAFSIRSHLRANHGLRDFKVKMTVIRDRASFYENSKELKD